MVKKILKKITPKFLLGWYHYFLALTAAIIFGFPSKDLTVIGVTGTSGKSTTIDFITRILEEGGNRVASLSSIRFKIASREWKDELKRTMPGRFVIQKFLKDALQDGCRYVVLEVTSEGIKQYRHKFINFDTAVFTNLSKEHIEAHGGFENYRNEKIKLFRATKKNHVVNADDENAKFFLQVPVMKKFTFGIKNKADVMAEQVRGTSFLVKGVQFNLQMLGNFNVYNALAAISVATLKNISLETCKSALEKATGIPGRMEVVSQNPFVVVDFAHTPEQLEQAYISLASQKLICVLGSCGGGRDVWKRPAFGQVAKKYCQEIIITNEDPYDEDPMKIIHQVSEGAGGRAIEILDRREAIRKAISLATEGEAVVITGKGSEFLMCLENGKKIPWDDRTIAKEAVSALRA